MGTDLGSAPSYSGQASVSYTSVEEAEQGKGPEGQGAPEGADPVAVESGDTISSLMAQQGLDWNNPTDRRQFLADNPQFITREDVEEFPELASLFDPDSGRNPNLIWPGEVVYIRPPQSDTGGGNTTDKPPVNGTVATGNVDANGQPEYQNYHNGQPVGPPYTSPQTESGQPANADTIDSDGNVIRTGEDGRPLTGWAPTTAGANGSDGGEVEYTYYVDGRATTNTVTSSDGMPEEAPEVQEADYAKTKIDQDGWYVVSGSSQAAQWAYFIDGHEVANTRTTNSRDVDDPAPVVGPEPPKNGSVATSPPNESGYAVFQNYVDGEPVGPPYSAQMGANGQPANADAVDSDGNTIRTDANGEPANGWAPTTPGANGSGGGETEYTYYEDGVPTGVTRTTTDGVPTSGPTSSELTDAAAQASSSADAAHNNAAEDENPDIAVYEAEAQQAAEDFDAAVLNEIEETTELPPNANREDRAKAVIAAAERIAQRLEEAGLQDQADRVRELAQERADEINNEV